MASIGIRLNEKLVKKMKEYVEKMKRDRSYSLTELIRVAVEEYLNKEEGDG